MKNSRPITAREAAARTAKASRMANVLIAHKADATTVAVTEETEANNATRGNAMNDCARDLESKIGRLAPDQRRVIGRLIDDLTAGEDRAVAYARARAAIGTVARG